MYYFIPFLFALLFPTHSWAACSGYPAGVAGTDWIEALSGTFSAGQKDHMINLHGANGLAGMMTYDPTDNDLKLCDGTNWVVIGSSGGSGSTFTDIGGDSHTTDDLAIGQSSAPAASAALEIESTTKGFLPPRMTTAQRDAIASPAAGLIIFNTSNKNVQFYTSSTWVSLAAAADGLSASTAAASCKAILDNGFSTANGTYWVQPAGQAFQVYCDMTTDGGGWTIVQSNQSILPQQLSVSQYLEFVQSVWQQNATEFLWHVADTDDSLEGLVKIKFNNTYTQWHDNHTGDNPSLSPTWDINVPGYYNQSAITGIVRAVQYRTDSGSGSHGLHYKRVGAGEHFPWFDSSGTLTNEGYFCGNTGDCGYNYGTITGKKHYIGIR